MKITECVNDPINGFSNHSGKMYNYFMQRRNQEFSAGGVWF